jgi:hypothetical protein
VTDEVGPVRDEAERLVAALLARFVSARAASGLDPDTTYDPQQAQRVAKAVGDVAVAVTGLLRELSRPGVDGAPTGVGLGLRETFAGFAGGLIEAAGVDLHAAPTPADPPAWRTDEEDPWRAATRASHETPTPDGGPEGRSR